MRIAIESTLAQGRLTGMGQYVINLLKGLSDIADDKYEFLLFHSTREWSGPDFGKNFIPVSYYFCRQSLGIRYRLNKMLKKHSALTYSDVRERYEHFRSRCTEEKPKIFNFLKKSVSISKTKTMKNKEKEKGCTEPLYGKKSKCLINIVPVEDRTATFKINKKCIKRRQ